jgi:uncharacterized protein (DUF697 family)
MPSPLAEYDPEWEAFEAEAPEWVGERGYNVLGETAELELATELLAVTDERELDQFLGNLIRTVGRSVGSIVKSPLGKAIGRSLKGIIRKTLPHAGAALGTLAGGPLGASIGSRLAAAAGRALGLELEGMSHEDRELEVAKRFIRFAGDAVKSAAASASSDPDAAAHAAIAAAARRAAPGLLRFAGPMPSAGVSAGPGGPIRYAEETMHDIDQTQLESDFEMENYESGPFGWSGEGGDLLGEFDEMELASQLMEVNDEQELDQFLGNLIRRAGRALGRAVRSPEGQAIGSLLKGAARKMLPHAAGAVGAAFGGPLGARISSGLASLLNSEMEAESWDQEGWSGESWNQESWNQESWDQEDREFEGAKQFIRVAADTVRDTLSAGPYVEPMQAAQAAIARAMQTRAPSSYGRSPSYGMNPYAGPSRGRWFRRGNRIVLLGV